MKKYKVTYSNIVNFEGQISTIVEADSEAEALEDAAEMLISTNDGDCNTIAVQQLKED